MTPQVRTEPDRTGSQVCRVPSPERGGGVWGVEAGFCCGSVQSTPFFLALLPGHRRETTELGSARRVSVRFGSGGTQLHPPLFRGSTAPPLLQGRGGGSEFGLRSASCHWAAVVPVRTGCSFGFGSVPPHRLILRLYFFLFFLDGRRSRGGSAGRRKKSAGAAGKVSLAAEAERGGKGGARTQSPSIQQHRGKARHSLSAEPHTRTRTHTHSVCVCVCATKIVKQLLSVSRPMTSQQSDFMLWFRYWKLFGVRIQPLVT